MKSPETEPFFLISGDCNAQILSPSSPPTMLYPFVHLRLSRVRSADVLILVLAGSYGSIPEGWSISFTEAEYEEAEKNAKPILCYFEDKHVNDYPRCTNELLDFRKKL